MEDQLELDFSGLTNAVDISISWVNDTLALFMTAPAIYFVAFAVVGAGAGVARRFVPMKKR